jgi:hypothetical protein
MPLTGRKALVSAADEMSDKKFYIKFTKRRISTSQPSSLHLDRSLCPDNTPLRQQYLDCHFNHRHAVSIKNE